MPARFAILREAEYGALIIHPAAAPLLVCSSCKADMRLVGIETDAPGRDLFTFECDECGRIEARSARLT